MLTTLHSSQFCWVWRFFADKISQDYEVISTSGISVIGGVNLFQVIQAWASRCPSNRLLIICNDSVFNLLLKLFRGFSLDWSSLSRRAYWCWHKYFPSDSFSAWHSCICIATIFLKLVSNLILGVWQGQSWCALQHDSIVVQSWLPYDDMLGSCFLKWGSQ